MRRAKLAVPVCLLLAAAMAAPAASVTYSFQAEGPSNSGPMPGSFELMVPDFVTGSPMSQFTGTDFTSCSAPGTGTCTAEFYVGPSPISGLANDVGFGNDVCCFIYFFPDSSFTSPGTHTADPFHSAGNATLTVRVSDAPEPSTLGLAVVYLTLVAFGLWNRRSRKRLTF